MSAVMSLSQDSLWLSLEQPSWVSPGHHTAHVGVLELFLPCSCAPYPPGKKQSSGGQQDAGGCGAAGLRQPGLGDNPGLSN